MKCVLHFNIVDFSTDPPVENSTDGQNFPFGQNYIPQASLNIPNVSFGQPKISPNASPNPLYHNYDYQIPSSPHYNIPVHSPNHGAEAYGNHMRTMNITDMDSLNLQFQHQPFQPQNDFSDYRAINLPLNDCNAELIDSHLLSNLSLHDDDSNDAKKSGQNESISSANIPPELPVLTFSAMLTSGDLEVADSFTQNSSS